MYKQLLTLLLLLSVSIVPQSHGQTSLAVTEFRYIGVSDNEAVVLTERLRSELFGTNSFKIVEREMMNEILSEQGFQQSGCVSDECMVKMGKLIGVGQIVGGTISRLQGIYTISARLVSVESGEILNIATYDCKCSIEDLLKSGMKQVAQKLTENSNLPTDTQSNELPPKQQPEKWGIFPFQLSFFYPMQVVPSSVRICGLRINTIYGNNVELNGLDVGIVNNIRTDLRGLQVGIINSARSTWGLQAGIQNTTHELGFAQLGLINSGKHIIGTQIGLINSAESLTGVQIGLLNTIKYTAGPSFMPFINISF
ncbi:hypothetical protein JW960_21040 [candidate division KSB1 bacterium]|nr:hypothetical protein [candidate division KSB1 bacterium]